MKKTLIDYTKNVIYKIVCNDMTVNDLYIGSTTNFIKRKGQHRRNCNNENYSHYNYKIYQIIRNNGGWENWSMIEIEKFPCNNSNESRLRERYYLELLQASMNVVKPTRTIQEYKAENKDKMREYKQLYYLNNKKKILLNQKKYNEENKEKKLLYIKKWREENKEKMYAQMKEYRERKKNNLKSI